MDYIYISALPARRSLRCTFDENENKLCLTSLESPTRFQYKYEYTYRYGNQDVSFHFEYTLVGQHKQEYSPF